MKKLISSLLIFLLTASVAIICTACSLKSTANEEKEKDTQEKAEPNSVEKNDLLALAFEEAKEIGFEGSFEEFIKLLKGEDGITPTIEISNDGFWVINGTKTEIKAIGEKGDVGPDGQKGDEGAKEDTGEAGNGIISVELTSSEGKVDTYTITFSDGTKTTFNITNGIDGEKGDPGISGIQGQPGEKGEDGARGEKGEDGNGIVSIELTSSEANIDVYTITFSDGSKTTFNVTNGIDGEKGEDGERGSKGEDGNSIISIELSYSEANVDTYKITFSNGTFTTFNVTNGTNGEKGEDGARGPQGEKGTDGAKGDAGEQGPKGDKGNGIASIDYTSSNGNVDTYTITFSDGSTTEFTVTNGINGEKGEVGADGAQGPQGEKGNTGAQGPKGDRGETGAQGPKGETGADGAGIKSVEFDENGDLIITLTDETVLPPVEVPELKNDGHILGDWQIYGADNGSCDANIFYAVCIKCNHIEWKLGAYTSHSFEIETVPPTCIAQGYDLLTCSKCGATEKSNYTEIGDHTPKNTYVFTSASHSIECLYCEEIVFTEEHDISETPCSVCGAEPLPTDGVLYEISEDGTYAAVVGYVGTATGVRIASKYEDIPVTVIGENAFEKSNVKSVILPDSITSIKKGAFNKCYSLTNIVLSKNLLEISEKAFSNCSSLTDITLPQSVNTVKSEAFLGCSRLVIYCEAENGSFDYSWNAKRPIVWNSLYNDVATDGNIYHTSEGVRYSLKDNEATVIIQSADAVYAEIASQIYYNGKTYTVTKIDTKAFYDCELLKTVIIPATITTIESSAFNENSSFSVYYIGSEDEWALITLAQDSGLSDITVYYNYKKD